MRTILISFVLILISVSSYAADTISIKQVDVPNISFVCDTTGVSAKTGKPIVKYYAKFNKTLYSSTKTTMEYVKLCKKHGCDAILVMIDKKKIVKR